MRKMMFFLAVLSTVALMMQGCRSIGGGRSMISAPPPEQDFPPAITPDRSESKQVEQKIQIKPIATESTVIGCEIPVDKPNSTCVTSKSKPDFVLPPSTTPQTPSTATSDEMITYTVKSGDSLSMIANSHGVKTFELADVNGISHDKIDKIQPGQKLKIPSGRKPFPTIDTASGNVHVVAGGETLSVIAKKYGIKTADLAAANNISDANMIREGQKLVIPGASGVVKTELPGGGGKKHAVTPANAEKAPAKTEVPAVKPVQGDVAPVSPTVEEIPGADDVKEPSKDGGFSDLFRTDGANVVTPPTPPKPTVVPVESAKIREHIVSEGEDIFSISIKYSVAPHKIRELNGLPQGCILNVGQVLKIPESAK